MGKARKKNSKPPQAASFRQQPEKSRQKFAIWPLAHWLILASGWLASLFLGLLELPAKVVSFANNAPEAKEVTSNLIWNYGRYTGRFSSDPNAWTALNLISDGTHPKDTGQIQLDIAYDGNGNYSGEIHSLYMAKNSYAPWSRVMISGSVGVTGAFYGEVWDIVQNRHATYTKFKLSVENEARHTLKLTPLVKDDGIFPGEITLWPTDYEMADGVRGTKFYETLMRVIKADKTIKFRDEKNKQKKETSN